MDPAEQVIKRLITTVKCSSCGSNYESGGINVLGHQDELWFLAVTCNHCHTQGLVAALVRDTGKEKIAAAPDSSEERETLEPELTMLHPSSEVTPDDVLQIRDFLQEFDGDFARLFGSSDRKDRPS